MKTLWMIILAGAVAAVAWAESASTGASTTVTGADWTGYYQIALTAKALGDLKPLYPDLNVLMAEKLQPWAKMRMEATDGVAEDTGQVCLPDGLFRYPGFAGAFLFLPTAEKVLLVYGQMNTAGIQRIYLNRKEHPRNLLPTWNGDSIGHWDGDTLYVDTIGFSDKSWLHSGMSPHTEETHLMQRIRRVKDGAYIEILYTIEDRHALTSAAQYSRYYRKSPGTMPENICAEDADTWKAFKNKALERHLKQAREVK